MIEGEITQWNDAKGFGFITVASSKERLFFHLSSFKTKGIRPDMGQEVVFKNLKMSKVNFKQLKLKLKVKKVNSDLL